MLICLRDFIATGAFGPLSLGANREEVKSAFGVPPTWSTESACERAAIWKYGDIEFHFDNDRLWLIFADDFDQPRGGASLQIEAWIVRRDLSLAAAETALQGAGIAFGRQPAPDREGITLLSTAGVALSFRGPHFEELYSLSAA
jgi:hypothetical protein